MEYLLITIVLFALLIFYFKVADKYNIIDKPNHRSAHTEITLRGGGIIFPVAFLLFLGSQIIQQKSITNPQNYFIFGIGLLAICIISFMDDILDLSSKIRLVFHFISVTILLYFINAFHVFPLWVIPVLYIIIIGILNAYNFMDGINGMTGLYSLVTLGSLLYINQNQVAFTTDDFIIYPLLASLVFLFFNFRKKAKCFMGDVGSMGIAFWIVTLLALLLIKTQDLKYVLFLTIYGTEVVLTIIERIMLRENILEAHRRHLYQLFSNEKKVSHLVVSFIYAALQLIINTIVISVDKSNIILFLIIILPSVLGYLALKKFVKKEIEQKKNK